MGRIRINRVFVSRRELGETLRPVDDSFKAPGFRRSSFRAVERPVVAPGLGGDLAERDVVNEQVTREGTAEIWEPMGAGQATLRTTRMKRFLASMWARLLGRT